MLRRSVPVAVLLLACLVPACGGSSDSHSDPATTGDPAADKLAQVEARGTLVLSTDPAYPPQSYAVKGAKRLKNTRCQVDQMTANQMAGYDADTSKLVAKALHVEPCFVVPTWTEMITGNWGDRWDLAIVSMGITRKRMHGLYFTQPYSAEAERFFVRRNAPYTAVSQLSGKRLGGCTGCFAQDYINGTLDAPGQDVTFEAKHGTFVGYALEKSGLADVAAGKLPAFLCGVAVGAKAITAGEPLRALGGDQYVAYLSGAIDKSSGLSVANFYRRVNSIVRELQARGTLKRLSLHYFHHDFASRAQAFDVGSLNQHVQ